MSKVCTAAVYGLIATCALIGFGSKSGGQTSERQPFEDELYSIVPLHHFGMGEKSFAQLTSADKRDLIACRASLTGMFRSIENRGNSLAYLTPELARNYKTATEFAASVIAPETSTLAVGVSGFEFDDGRTSIRLRCFALLSSEGLLVVSERSVTFRKSGEAWKVASIN